MTIEDLVRAKQGTERVIFELLRQFVIESGELAYIDEISIAVATDLMGRARVAGVSCNVKINEAKIGYGGGGGSDET